MITTAAMATYNAIVPGEVGGGGRVAGGVGLLDGETFGVPAPTAIPVTAVDGAYELVPSNDAVIV